MELKTPLYDCHVALGGKIVPFAGYLLPVEYKTGVIAEHMATRTKAGLFDVSHMGEVLFEGADARANIQKLLCNDYTVMENGRARYSPMCNENGGIVDDLIVYKISDVKYLIVINASNREKDVQWMKKHLFGDVKFTDISDNVAQIALQGPRALEILRLLTPEAEIPVKYYSFVNDATVSGKKCIISKTGYTGEDGCEIYCSPDDAVYLWNKLLEAGEPYGLIPCGLGARDTLRLEAAMPLYGHEMTDDISPIEAGLNFACKLQKEDFIGKSAIEKRGVPTHVRVGLRVTGRGIVREHCELFAGSDEIGYSTSGTFAPYLNTPIAMAMVKSEYSAVGTKLCAKVRGRDVEVEVVPLPFYKRK